MPAKVHDRKRYPETVDPVTTDGRDIDTSIGTLSGEGSEQEAKREAEQVEQLSPKPWTQAPSVEQESPTYYDRPLLKESVWSVDIPLYYYVNKHLVSPKLKGWYDNVMNVVYSQDLEIAPT